MFYIDKIIVNNFLSYRGKQVIPLYEQGVVRVEGINKDNPAAESNMSGKSAIVDALCWCLFNKTIRGVKHDAVIHRRVKKDCSVSVYFRKDSIRYRATRYRKHSSFRNRIALYRTGACISFRHDTETQKKIEGILGCDYTAFVNSVVFGGVTSFASKSDSEQKKILESFLHFEKVDSALRRTKEKLENVGHSFEKLEDKITKQSYHLLSRRGDLKQYIARSHSDGIRSANLREKMQGLNRRLRKETTRVKVQTKTNARIAMERYVGRRTKAHLALGIAQGTLESARQDLYKLQSAAARLNKLGAQCTYCGSLVTPKTKARYKQHLLRDQSLAVARINEAKTLVAERRREVDATETKLEKLRHSLLILQEGGQRRRGLEERMRELKSELSSISDSLPNNLDAEIKHYSRSVAKLLQLERDKARLLKEQRDLEFWKEGFGNKGIKAMIVREAIPAMNEKLQEFSQKIFEEPVELKFLAAKESKSGEDRELFHVQYSNSKGASSYLGESAGGRRRIDLCVLLVLSWLSRVCNLLLVDELLDGLDETGRERALEILSGWKGTVLIISHRRDVCSRIGKIWRVTKQHGNSSIEL